MGDSIEQNMTRLELGPLDDQNLTSYAQMLENQFNMTWVRLPGNALGRPLHHSVEESGGLCKVRSSTQNITLDFEFFGQLLRQPPQLLLIRLRDKIVAVHC